MDKSDYAELFMLVKGAEQALLSGELNEWQHANTSTFHVLATMILDLNDRLAKLEPSAYKPVECTFSQEFFNGI